MTKRAQLSTGDNTTKTWNPTVWKRKESSTTVMVERTDIVTSCTITSNMAMVCSDTS